MKRTASRTTNRGRKTKKQKTSPLHATPPLDGSSPFLSYFADAKDALFHGRFLDGYDIAILRLVNKELRNAISPKWGVSVTRALLSLCDKGELKWLQSNKMPVTNTDVFLSFVDKRHDRRDLTILSEYFDFTWMWSPWPKWSTVWFAHCCTTLEDTRSFELIAPDFMSYETIEWIEILACEGTVAMKHWFRHVLKRNFSINSQCDAGQWQIVRALVALYPENRGVDQILLCYNCHEAASIYLDFGGELNEEIVCVFIDENSVHWLREIVSREHTREKFRTIVTDMLNEAEEPSLSAMFGSYLSPEMADILSTMGLH
jgi:hypothetical protein